jgi:antitoxin FitA
MATLYVRNVPDELYARLQRLAVDDGRSLNAAVLAFLETEVERRDRRAELDRLLEQLASYPPVSGTELLIREDRDRGHKPELGY